MTITKLNENQRCIDKMKSLMWKQTEKHPLGMPEYYGVLYYGKSFTGGVLDQDTYNKRWNIKEVKKTHEFVNKLIRKTFGSDIPIWWSIERHSDYTNNEGDTIKGSFHSNIFVGSINDYAIEDPSPYLMPLFYKQDESGIPINMRNVDTEQMKLLLLNACIRQAKWVGSHPDALKLYRVPASEMEQTFMYSLKDLNSNLQQFDEVVDFDNSSYYKP